ncbi:MAG: TIGR04182 family glycosyltransferase, partial [Candidatus Aenigmatarchaeota archaeon]
PMVFFGIPGLLLLLGGLALGAYLVDVWFEIGSFAGHTASVMLTALMIISGGLFIFMGMLADMMQQKYFQIRALLKLQDKACH